MTTLPTHLLPFDHPAISIENAGGKGANLARLAQAGYAVPGGFIVSTAAYQEFVQANQLEPRLLARLADLPADPAALEAASRDIRAWFAAGSLPEALAGALRQAYAALGQPAVAVRSSATAEDLPELSFAGQQDTYLNVTGEAALLAAVLRCWGSLWTARAIGYRQRNGLPQAGLALAVVVQQMIQSEVSGVLFTANPLSGLRSELVIDATFGLGEALVSGQVEPDHYVVGQADGPRILSKTLGAKALAIRSQPGGGVTAVGGDVGQAGQTQALPDEQILALAEMGWRVQDEYGFPQDIEWAWADGKLYLLQSRPITSLFPVP
jgi:pyruvate,water dikinase